MLTAVSNVDLVRVEHLLHLRELVLDPLRRDPGRPERGPAAGQQAVDRSDVERRRPVLEKAAPAVAEADDLAAVVVGRGPDDGPDDGIETGAVAPAGEDTDAHRSSLDRRRADHTS
jgi:hypothetical protein